jgi:hypothetical protein
MYRSAIIPRIFFLGLIAVCFKLSAQVDTVYFVTGDFLIGEVKKLEKNLLVVETKYSDSDFIIEWDKVTGIRTQSQFMIAQRNGVKYYGRLYALSDSAVQILTSPMTPVMTRFEDIVFLEAYDDKFKDRFSVSVDVGLDMAKANTLRRWSTRVAMGYQAEKWSTNGFFHTLQSTQDEAEDIQRTEAEANLRYVLPKRWYAVGTISGLSNSEQKLEIRRSTQAGLGKFLARTNTLYWGAKIGVNRNIERYTSETDDRQSWEGYFGTELNLYNVGDIDLIFDIMAYPSITETGRWRTDLKFNIKYDLPLDFYIKLGFTLNYDNQSANDASDEDYLFQAGVGWEW